MPARKCCPQSPIAVSSDCRPRFRSDRRSSGSGPWRDQMMGAVFLRKGLKAEGGPWRGMEIAGARGSKNLKKAAIHSSEVEGLVVGLAGAVGIRRWAVGCEGDVLTAFAAMLLEHVSFFSPLLARALAAGAGLWVHQGACENTKVHGAGVH